MTDKPALTLYTKTGCHLCEEMKQQLDVLQQQYEFSLNLVNIDADSYLRLRYGERIPVLTAGEREICHFKLNDESLMEYFK